MRRQGFALGCMLGILAHLATGCGGLPDDLTTVRLTDGTELRGEIVAANGTNRTIDFVEAPEWTVNVMGVPVGPDGKRWQLATRDVAEVEHISPFLVPFNWAMAGFGAALVLGGVIWLESDPPDEEAIGAVTLLLLGSGLALGGTIFAIYGHVWENESQALWNEAQGGAQPAPAGSGGQLGVSMRF